MRNVDIEGCFDIEVVAFDVVHNDRDAGPVLVPELAEHVRRAVPARRREFAFGRACAHRAIEALVGSECVVGRGGDRAPVWPDGICGSISHVDGYAVAVVGRAKPRCAIGVDVVPIGGVTEDVAAMAFNDGERTRLMAAGATDPARALALGFGAKEAVYKAQHPLTGRWVDFDEVEVTRLDGDLSVTGQAELAPSRGSPLAGAVEWPVRVRWIEIEHRIVVGVTMSAPHAVRTRPGSGHERS